LKNAQYHYIEAKIDKLTEYYIIFWPLRW